MGPSRLGEVDGTDSIIISNWLVVVVNFGMVMEMAHPGKKLLVIQDIQICVRRTEFDKKTIRKSDP